MAAYRLPERVQVNYVAFEISNRMAQAEAELVKTNFTEMIDHQDTLTLGMIMVSPVLIYCHLSQ